MKPTYRTIRSLPLVIAIATLGGGAALAQTTYTWDQTAGGAQSWTTGTNWNPDIIGGPSPVSGDTVDFSTVNIAANTTLTLDADRIAEIWKFGDTSNGQDWTVNAGNKITLAGATPPTINVVNRTATLNNVLDGSAGLTKSGGGALTLAGTNTFTGDVTLSGGTLTFSNLNAWGGTGKNVAFAATATLASTANGYVGGQLSVAGGQTATVSTSTLSFASASGSGTLVFNTNSNKTLNIGNAGALTGTLQGKLSGNANIGTGIALQFSALDDAVGSALQFIGGTSDSNQGYTIAYNGTSALTFDNRQVQILDRTGSNWEIRDNILANNCANPDHTWVINTDLLYLGGRAQQYGPQTGRTFVLSGTNTGNNEFAGNITDGVVAGIPFNVAKYGSGTWLLSGTNTHSGTTTVTAGKLVLPVGSSSANSAVTVSAGTLSVAVTDTTQQWTGKSLTHTAASTLEFAFGSTVPSTTVAPLVLAGDVAFNATPTVSCTGDGLTGLAAGAYPLLAWTGTMSGFAPSAVTLSSGSGILVKDETNKTLWLILDSSRPAITWQGPAGSEWKANEVTYTYWQDATPATTYYQENTVGGALVGDSVVFGATGVGTVTLNTTVSPRAVSFNTASPDNYTISGSGGIAGGGSLTKAGTSTLTLLTDNTYSGGTMISAGTVQVGNGGTSGSLGSGSVANNGTLEFNVTDDITVGSVSGTGALIQNGSGVLTHGGTSNYTGTTTINAGTLLLNTVTTNTFTSATTVNSGGTLKLGAADRIVNSAAVTVNSGGTFDLNGNAETIARTAGTGGSVTNTGALATLTLTGAGTQTISNTFSGVLNLSIQGSSLITLTGSSNYTGSTTVGTSAVAGTKVLLGTNNALPSGTTIRLDGTGTTIGLDLKGYNQALGPMTLHVNQNWGTMEVTDSVGGGVLTLTGGAAALTLDPGNNPMGKISVTTLDLNNATQTLTNGGGVLTITSVIQNGALTKAGSNTLVLTGANIYSGSTLVSAGTLRLDNTLALQNSPVDTSGAGVINANNGAGTYSLGGLSGSKNLASVITTGLANMTTLNLNPQSGTDVSYSGIIPVNGTMGVTKTGAGKQTLSGANTYTGDTVVTQGTLALVGGSQKSHITVDGGSLGFTLGSPTTSTAALTLTSGTVVINGTVDNATDYLLMTASGITGTPTLASPIPNYTLQKTDGDTKLQLVYTGGSPYQTWASTNAPTGDPDADYDGDGVSNAVEFVLGGDKDTNDLGKLPVAATTATDVTFTFQRDQASIATGTGLSIEVGTDLANWTTPGSPFAVPDGAAANNPGVTVVKDSPVAGTDTITLTLPKAPDAKKFARLKVAIAP